MRTSALIGAAMALASITRSAGTPIHQAKADAYGMDLAAFLALPKHGAAPKSRSAGWRQKHRRRLARQRDRR